ncbi:hypothetical protein BU26DRAFT_570096 [Trematosphaeria pertusa]|uniref:Uncharacterized protein n=1 Tax=Trematosphaeria pertusa TaxID=390896 RepID=A0A6A6I1E4_9PLEO|nr:uncharacterized protein BU26DRAFT_570096 [Trematosphaeria pertusa]KAF2243400.1 hypothetical protein BU26DRAFT_570096 [Trematosphaeria pertusa]
MHFSRVSLALAGLTTIAVAAPINSRDTARPAGYVPYACYVPYSAEVEAAAAKMAPHDKRGIQAEYAPYTCYGSYSDEVEAEAAKMALRASSFPFVRFPGF